MNRWVSSNKIKLIYHVELVFTLKTMRIYMYCQNEEHPINVYDKNVTGRTSDLIFLPGNLYVHRRQTEFILRIAELYLKNTISSYAW